MSPYQLALLFISMSTKEQAEFFCQIPIIMNQCVDERRDRMYEIIADGAEHLAKVMLKEAMKRYG